jgi:hypothetical protein
MNALEKKTYSQSYHRAGFDLMLVGETVQVHLSRQNRVLPDAIRQFAGFKARVLQQFTGVIHETF